MVLDEFKLMHNTLAHKIEETYTIGNRMLEYLEKQLILDYHLRGEQEVLEKDHPELAEQAKKYLGHELYYELSKEDKLMNVDNPAYMELVNLASGIDDKFQGALDMYYNKANGVGR